MSKSSNWESTIKPIVVLSVISLIASLLLALVNGMTAPVIAENTKRTTLAAYVGVLPSVSDASELEEVTDYTTAGITGVVEHFTYLGREAHLTVQAQGHRLVAQIAAPPADLAIEAGREIRLGFDRADLHAFDAAGRRVETELAA